MRKELGFYRLTAIANKRFGTLGELGPAGPGDKREAFFAYARAHGRLMPRTPAGRLWHWLRGVR